MPVSRPTQDGRLEALVLELATAILVSPLEGADADAAVDGLAEAAVEAATFALAGALAEGTAAPGAAFPHAARTMRAIPVNVNLRSRRRPRILPAGRHPTGRGRFL